MLRKLITVFLLICNVILVALLLKWEPRTVIEESVEIPIVDDYKVNLRNPTYTERQIIEKQVATVNQSNVIPKVRLLYDEDTKELLLVTVEDLYGSYSRKTYNLVFSTLQNLK